MAFGGLLLTIDQAAHHDQSHPADAIIVLGAGVRENGAPSPALIARVRHAAALYHRGYAPLIALTGGAPDERPTEAEVAYQWLRGARVPSEAIIMESTSRTTAQNLTTIAPLLRERDAESVIIVTSPFHAWRSNVIAQDAGFVVYVSPAPDDPAERHPARRVYYIMREGLLGIAYLLFGL